MRPADPEKGLATGAAAAGLGLRDRKKLEAAATLAQVAKRLFAARGFEEVTVDEIAAAANVSRRTFFRYYPQKEDVFFGRRAAQLAALEALLAARPLAAADEAPFATVRRALLALADLHVESRSEILAEHRILAGSPELLARDLEWDRRVLDLLAATLERGGGDPRRARLAAAAIVGVLRVVIERWVESGGRTNLRAEGEEALALLEPMAPPAGRRGRVRGS
jgi:AcrR family transcriptional regulator